jgi:uncharacterized protein YbjT (DUF2867 family)
MNIVITGSLGNISKPLTQELGQKGHSVTVISHNPAKQKNIEALGARAAIGTIEDARFLAKTFTGADIVYVMKPPFDIFDKNIDVFAFYTHIAKQYVQAILQSGIKNVVVLSSIGGHTDKGIGMLRFHHEAEDIFKGLPSNICIKFMRPVGFYNNMFAFIPTIKAQNAIILNFGGVEKLPWVSPLDIAAVIAEEIEKPFDGREIRYIASDEVSCNEIVKVLGEAIGKPDLKWITVSDEQLLNSMAEAGMSASLAKDWVDANASISRVNGVWYEDYNRNKPTLGKVKLKDFAKEFATVFEKELI